MDMDYLLTDSYGVNPVVIIDSYDTPIKAGADNDYGIEVVTFMNNLLLSGLSGSRQRVKYAFLCGELPVYPANNFNIEKINSYMYAGYFGFTAEETKELLAHCGMENRFDDVRRWYGGYMFSNTEIFNPQSVMRYISNNAAAKVYKSNDDFVGRHMKAMIFEKYPYVQREFEELMCHKTRNNIKNAPLNLDELTKYMDVLLGAMVHTGYLTPTEDGAGYGSWTAVIPNNEIYEMLDILLYVSRKKEMARNKNTG